MKLRFPIAAVNPIAVLESLWQEKLSHSRFLDAVSIAASLGAFVHGFVVIQGQLFLANGAFRHDMNKEYPEFSRDFTSALFCGELVGSLFSFPFMDELGRRFVLKFSSLFCLASLAISLVAISPTYLLSSRLLAGITLGAMSNASAVYLAEIAPSSYRGRCIVLSAVNSLVGGLLGSLAAWAAFALAPVHFHTYGWRAGLLLPMAALGLQAMTMHHLPDSPRWLLANKTPTDCNVALEFFRRSHTCEEFSGIYRALALDARLSDSLWDLLCISDIRFRLAVNAALECSQFASVHVAFWLVGIALYGGDPSRAGPADGWAVLVALFAVGLGGALAAYRLVDSVGRRVLLQYGSAAAAACWILSAGAFRLLSLSQLAARVPGAGDTPSPAGLGPAADWAVHNESVPAQALHYAASSAALFEASSLSLSDAPWPGLLRHALVALLFSAILLHYGSLGSAAAVPVAEVFPYRARAKLSAVSTCVSIAAAFESATLTARGSSRDALAPHAAAPAAWTLWWLSLSSLLALAVVLAFLPETKGMILEDVSELLGASHGSAETAAVLEPSRLHRYSSMMIMHQHSFYCASSEADAFGSAGGGHPSLASGARELGTTGPLAAALAERSNYGSFTASPAALPRSAENLFTDVERLTVRFADGERGNFLDSLVGPER